MADAHHFTAREAGEAGNGGHADGNGGVNGAKPEQNNDRQREQQRRNGQQHVDKTHQERLDASGERPGDHPQAGACHQPHRDGSECGAQGVGRTIHNTGVNIAAKLIGAEPVARLRRQTLRSGDALNRAVVG